MRRIWSWFRRLGRKWKALIIVVVIVLIVVAVVLGVYCRNYWRNPPDYSKILAKASITYLVSYDSGDGDVVNESTFTLKVAETDVAVGNKTCFYTVTVMDPYPARKVHAIIVGTTKVTLASEEIWRSQEDLRCIQQEAMQINLPIVGTAITDQTYSGYDGYPGWPYSLGDSWTYEIYLDPDTPLQSNWTDTYHAEVVADDAVVVAAGAEYECFKVVHTLVDTEQSTPGGAGIGSTRIEYWAKTGKSIAPLKVENNISYMGTESRIMVDIDLPEGSEWLIE